MPLALAFTLALALRPVAVVRPTFTLVILVIIFSVIIVLKLLRGERVAHLFPGTLGSSLFLFFGFLFLLNTMKTKVDGREGWGWSRGTAYILLGLSLCGAVRLLRLALRLLLRSLGLLRSSLGMRSDK